METVEFLSAQTRSFRGTARTASTLIFASWSLRLLTTCLTRNSHHRIQYCRCLFRESFNWEITHIISPDINTYFLFVYSQPTLEPNAVLAAFRSAARSWAPKEVKQGRKVNRHRQTFKWNDFLHLKIHQNNRIFVACLIFQSFNSSCWWLRRPRCICLDVDDFCNLLHFLHSDLFCGNDSLSRN